VPAVEAMRAVASDRGSVSVGIAEGPGMEPAAHPSEAPAAAQAVPAAAAPRAVAPGQARPAGVAPVVPKPQPLDADALFAIADDARLTRDYRGAISALERVIREYAADPRAKLAAFTIGRIRDEHLQDLAGATVAYEQALSLGLSGSLAEDCYSRLLRVLDLQAMKRLVARERVQQAAQQYLQRYPKGRYAAEARGFLEAKAAP
jgi:TolA-binding protein